MESATSGDANHVPPQRRVTRPASIAPSISSVLSDATTITAPAHEQRGFRSREAYLAALHEFAESKMYMPAGDHTLHGFYGGKTMDDYKNRPGLRSGKDKKKNKKPGGLRGDRNVVNAEGSTAMPVILESLDSHAQDIDSARATSETVHELRLGKPEKQGKLRRFSWAFSGGSGRRATIS